MGFINFKTKENTRKCVECKFNIANFDFNIKQDQKGYLKFLGINYDQDDNEITKKIILGVKKVALGTMWSACKVCPVRPDFIKVYGVEPIEHYTELMPDPPKPKEVI